jgi:hypothetical protein
MAEGINAMATSIMLTPAQRRRFRGHKAEPVVSGQG